MSNKKADELPSANTEANTQNTVETQKALKWQSDGGERVGGINVLPRWSIYTEEFPDISGKTGCGIVSYSKSTFAYLDAKEDVKDKILRAVNAFDDLLEAAKVAIERLDRLDDAGSGSNSPAYFQIKAAIRKSEQP